MYTALILVEYNYKEYSDHMYLQVDYDTEDQQNDHQHKSPELM